METISISLAKKRIKEWMLDKPDIPTNSIIVVHKPLPRGRGRSAHIAEPGKPKKAILQLMVFNAGGVHVTDDRRK